MLTEYLKAGIILQGLQVINVPGIFREDQLQPYFYYLLMPLDGARCRNCITARKG